MSHRHTEPRFLNNGYLLLEHGRAIIHSDEARRWEILREMARRLYPKGTLTPSAAIVLADFRHWKCNGAQEAYE